MHDEDIILMRRRSPDHQRLHPTPRRFVPMATTLFVIEPEAA